MEDEEKRWQRRLERERLARQEAEKLLEDKSLELWQANKRLEASAAEEKGKFQKVFDSAIDGILLHTCDGRILDGNNQICRMLDYGLEALKTKLVSELHPASSLPICKEAFEKVNQLGETRFICEFKRSDGSFFPAEVSASTLEISGQTIVQGVVRDITEREKRNAEIREARDEAERANHAKSMFLAAMSHEIRTPLNAVLGYVDLMLEEPRNDNDMQRLQVIRRSGDLLLHLLNDLLDFARIESGLIELTEEEFSPRKLVSEVVNLQQPAAESHAIEFICVSEPAVPDLLVGDEARLKQVLLNLVSNAMKHGQRGRVWITLSTTENEMHMSVRDEGEGFPAEMGESIFEPFIQAESGTIRKSGGAGLGLAICARLMTAMGGGVRALLPDGGGAEFICSWPIRTQSESTPNRPKSFAAEISEAKIHGTILIVDDEPVNTQITSLMLERSYFNAVTAGSGPEALEVCKEHPHLCAILMDMRMPEMDGLETTRRIRLGEGGMGAKSIPIIALTANAMEEDRRACLDAGMTGFLTKPIRLEKLRRSLQRAGLTKTKAP